MEIAIRCSSMTCLLICSYGWPECDPAVRTARADSRQHRGRPYDTSAANPGSGVDLERRAEHLASRIIGEPVAPGHRCLPAVADDFRAGCGRPDELGSVTPRCGKARLHRRVEHGQVLLIEIVEIDRVV